MARVQSCLFPNTLFVNVCVVFGTEEEEEEKKEEGEEKMVDPPQKTEAAKFKGRGKGSDRHDQ